MPQYLENNSICYMQPTVNCVILNTQTISLGALVPNSRDRHEKQWRPDFTCHKTHPKIRFV